MTAFEAVGRKKRVRLLPLAFRKYCCTRYANLRERGFEHGKALLLIQGKPEYRALPLWAMLLAQVLFYLLRQWWEYRNGN